MELNFVDVAFVLAAVAFFKAQFGLAKGWAILSSFLLALALGLAPVLQNALPNLAPWVDVVVNTVKVFLMASGSFDLAVDVFQQKAQVEAEVKADVLGEGDLG